MEAVTFKGVSFAEGRFRTAYMGTWTAPPSKSGKKCVVKEEKDSYTWKSTDWDTTVKIQKKAIELYMCWVQPALFIIPSNNYIHRCHSDGCH